MHMCSVNSCLKIFSRPTVLKDIPPPFVFPNTSSFILKYSWRSCDSDFLAGAKEHSKKERKEEGRGKHLISYIGM